MSIPPSASVSYRLPVVASVARAQALAGFGVNHDALSVSPKMAQRQLVPFGTQNIHCIGREAVFDENLIGEPLMMKPGCVDSFLDIEGEIDNADQNVGNNCDDPGAAGRAENQKKFAVFQHDSRGHGGERALAGADGIGGALDKSVCVGDALFGGEIVHFVVEQKAQAFGDDARAEGVVERSGDRDGVAFGIDDGIVGGVFSFANGGGAQLGYALQFMEDRWAFQLFAHAGMVEVDGVTPGGSVLFIDELRDRNFGEVRITHEIGAVVEGAAERFGFEVDGVGGAVAEFREVEAFENIEDFDERNSAGGWRRSADDVVSAIGAANGLAFFDFVGGEILGSDQASTFVDGSGEFAGHCAVVELVGIFGDAFEGVSEFGVLE